MESFSNSSFLNSSGGKCSVISNLYLFMCTFFPSKTFRKYSVDHVMLAKDSIIYSRHNMSFVVISKARESPGSKPRCYRFEVWAFSFTSRRLSRLSCINEYLAIDSGGNVSE